MPRYFTGRVRSLYVEDDVFREGCVPDTPCAPEHVAVDSGLVDMKGDTIWRAPERIGFRFGDDE